MTERMQRDACIPAGAGKQLVHGLLGESVGFAEHVLAPAQFLEYHQDLPCSRVERHTFSFSWLGKSGIDGELVAEEIDMTPGQRQRFRRNANPTLSSNHDHVLATTRAPASTRRCLCRSISKEEIWLSNFPAKDSES
jgi:hypothetical protein